MNHRMLVTWVFLLCSTAACAEDGDAIYQKRCRTCHSVGGSGGPMAQMGGALDGIGKRRDAQWLDGWVKNPKSKKPDTAMPAVRLSDEERDAVVKYMQSLQ